MNLLAGLDAQNAQIHLPGSFPNHVPAGKQTLWPGGSQGYNTALSASTPHLHSYPQSCRKARFKLLAGRTNLIFLTVFSRKIDEFRFYSYFGGSYQIKEHKVQMHLSNNPQLLLYFLETRSLLSNHAHPAIATPAR